VDTAYCLLYSEFFNPTRGTMRYLTADNRDFLLALMPGLEKS
jgi:hypothetical protein